MTEPDRDPYGRPLVIPPGGGDAVPYTRVSTLAKTLDDLGNLMAWKQRKTAEGLVKRPDLMTRLAGTLATGDPDVDYKTKRELNSICREATEAAGSSTGASAGTGLHGLTEAIDRGNEPSWVPEDIKPRLDAYREATAGYEPLEIELFVANDELQAAGTFDRLYRCPDGRVRVGDVKAGKWEARYPFATCVQIASYAHSERYDVETGARSPLHPDLDLTTGLLIHLPPSGGCQVVPLDLDLGWHAAHLAATVRNVRGLKADDIIRPAEPVQGVTA